MYSYAHPPMGDVSRKLKFEYVPNLGSPTVITNDYVTIETALCVH